VIGGKISARFGVHRLRTGDRFHRRGGGGKARLARGDLHLAGREPHELSLRGGHPFVADLDLRVGGRDLDRDAAELRVELDEHLLHFFGAGCVGVGRVEVALIRVRGLGVAAEQLQRRADVEQDLRARIARVRLFECRERGEVVLRLEQLHARRDERFRIAAIADVLRLRGGERRTQHDSREENAH